MCALFGYGTTFRAHHQCMAGREDKVFLRLMSCSVAQLAAVSARIGSYSRSWRAFGLLGRLGLLSSVPGCAACRLVATWLTSRWFRLATAKRRCSRHSGGVRSHRDKDEHRVASILRTGCRACWRGLDSETPRSSWDRGQATIVSGSRLVGGGTWNSRGSFGAHHRVQCAATVGDRFLLGPGRAV